MMFKKISFLPLFISSFCFCQISINTSNPKGIVHIDSRNNNPIDEDPSNEQQADDVIFTNEGKLGIGTINPDFSSIVDVDVSILSSGDKKGFMPPKVNLKSGEDIETIKNPATGLLVYNTGENPDFNFKGLAIWTGNNWQNINGKSLNAGKVDELNCNTSSLTPNTYAAKVPYEGILKIPYTGGNGGFYNSQKIGPINGLNLELKSNNLEIGSGTLEYFVSGTPISNSESEYIVPINFNNSTCNANIGGSTDFEPGTVSVFKYELKANDTGYIRDLLPYNNLPILGGKFEVDVYFSISANHLPDPGTKLILTAAIRLTNLSSSHVKVWYSSMGADHNTNISNLSVSANRVDLKSYFTIQNLFLNLGFNDILGINEPRYAGTGGPKQLEPIYADVRFDNKWYQLHFFMINDNLNTVNEDDNKKIVYLTVKRMH